MVTVIDGKGLIYGRLASNVAEMIMAGEEVVVLNAEQIIITGERSEILKDFKNKVAAEGTPSGAFTSSSVPPSSSRIRTRSGPKRLTGQSHANTSPWERSLSSLGLR